MVMSYPVSQLRVERKGTVKVAPGLLYKRRKKNLSLPQVIVTSDSSVLRVSDLGSSELN